jgi:ferric-dicitrate binding protein FerR (iron transport regulator)
VENKHIHRFLEGRPTPDEINALHKQLSEDPGSIIREMEQDWDMDNSSADFDSEKHWKVLENHLNASISPRQHSQVFYWMARIAASVLIMFGVWFAFKKSNSGYQQDGFPALVTHANESSQPETVVLKDGTKVTLAAKSSLSFYNNFNEKYRVVHLEGEAYFETEEENIRPFIVVSENITSICRSHQFSVSAFEESDEISVVSSSGLIEVAQNDKLNSEYNKVAVERCQRYSFSKSSQKFLIDRIADCDIEGEVQKLKQNASAKVVVML